MEEIELSVVVTVVSDTISKTYNLFHLQECLAALHNQKDPPSMEILVPIPAQAAQPPNFQGDNYLAKFIPIAELRDYPQKKASREHHDELRSRGIKEARGSIIALLEDYDRAAPTWSRAVLQAHRGNYGAIGGAIENGVDRPLNWAVYFCDFGRYQNPLHFQESVSASDANVAYKKTALAKITPTWHEAYHEIEVHQALWQAGERLALSPEMIVYQHRTDLSFGKAIRERFVWGRSFAARRFRKRIWIFRLLYFLLAFFLPPVLLMRQTINIVKKKRNVGKFICALPLIAILLVFWSLGEIVGYLTGDA